MISGLAALMLSNLLHQPEALILADEIRLDDRHIRVSDVIKLEELSKKQADVISHKVIYHLNENTDQLSLKRRDVARLLTKRVPGLSNFITPDLHGDITFKINKEVKTSVPKLSYRQCYQTKQALKARSLITHDNIEKSICLNDTIRPKIIFNGSSQFLRTSEDIEKGHQLGPIHINTHKYIDKGETLFLRVKTGVVTVEKRVKTTQPAAVNNFVFVEDETGQILRARLIQDSKMQNHAN